MAIQQKEILKIASQKFDILNNLDKEWQFLRQRIKIQESIWKNFKKPIHRQDILEDKQWAKDLTELISLYTKLHTLNLKYQEYQSESDIKLYTWQKTPSEKKSEKIFQKRGQILDKYYKLKIQFTKKYHLEEPI